MMRHDLNELVGDNGRVNFRGLTTLIETVSPQYFIDLIKHPLLVGKELYDGQMTQSGTYTMKFSKSMLTTHAAPSGAESKDGAQSAISKAIYMLRRKSYSALPPNVISIGRANQNDLVVADYSVSQDHAQIILFHGMYFIVDLHSTNGTVVCDKRIDPDVKVKLDPNQPVAFGRLVFILMSPMDLYHALKE